RTELLPLVERIGGDEAAAALERFAKGRLGGGFFGAGVDGCESAFGGFSPVGHEAPAEEGELTLAAVVIQADDGLHALRSCVVGRREGGHFVKVDTKPI